MPENKGKVVVTGGAGFIGTHVVPRLMHKGYAITVLDNLSTGKKQNLNPFLGNSNFEFIQGDIRDLAALQSSLKGAKSVVHLAALIDVAASVKNPAATNEVNVTGTLNVLHEAAKLRVRRVVFASSTAVYGDAEKLPVKEDSPIKPISPYAASKAACEAYCNAYTASFGLESVVLRFFNVYGPGNEGSPYSGVITKFLKQASAGEALTVEGDGEQTRDFIHVGDVADAVVLAVEKKNLNSDVFNVCTGTATSVNQIVDVLGCVVDKKLRVRHSSARAGDIRYSYGDGSKADKNLGFKPKVGIRDGLKRLYEAANAMGK